MAFRLGEDDGVEVCRALRAGPGGGELVVVVVGPQDAIDVGAALTAGANDV